MEGVEEAISLYIFENKSSLRNHWYCGQRVASWDFVVGNENI